METNVRELKDPVEIMEVLAKKVETLRGEALFDGVEDSDANPASVQHYLLAINALEQAERHFKLARHFQVRENSEVTLGHGGGLRR